MPVQVKYWMKWLSISWNASLVSFLCNLYGLILCLWVFVCVTKSQPPMSLPQRTKPIDKHQPQVIPPPSLSFSPIRCLHKSLRKTECVKRREIGGGCGSGRESVCSWQTKPQKENQLAATTRRRRLIASQAKWDFRYPIQNLCLI